MKQLKTFVSIGVVLMCSARPSFAQTPEERAGARAAAEQGVKAYAEGRWAAAVDLMTRAEKLVHAPTHLLYLAQAEEKLGHLVVAHETYLRLVRERLAPDAPEVFVNAQAEAKSRADALRPRLSSVSIVVQGDAAGTAVTVTMDGRGVPEALVGVPHPVDPGEHEFQATAEGMRSSRAKVTLREGGSDTVILTLQSTGAPKQHAKSTSGPAAHSEPTPTKVELDSPAMVPTTQSTGKTLRIVGYVGLGIGVAGIATGTVFAIRSHNSRSDANAYCSGGCREEDRTKIEDLDSEADTSERLSIAGFVAGGVGAVVGATMLLLAPSSKSEAPKSGLVLPYVSGNGAGVWGRF